MKNLTTVIPNATQESKVTTALEFADVVVYNEMADQTSVKLNLISQIHSQLNQLDEMTHRRQFIMKEILSLIAD